MATRWHGYTPPAGLTARAIGTRTKAAIRILAVVQKGFAVNRRSFLGTLVGAALTVLLAPRLLAAGPQLCGSAKAAAGWLCTRSAGHTGPCAAVRDPSWERPMDPGGWVSYRFKYTVTAPPPKSYRISHLNEAVRAAGKQAV